MLRSVFGMRAVLLTASISLACGMEDGGLPADPAEGVDVNLSEAAELNGFGAGAEEGSAVAGPDLSVPPAAEAAKAQAGGGEMGPRLWEPAPEGASPMPEAATAVLLYAKDHGRTSEPNWVTDLGGPGGMSGFKFNAEKADHHVRVITTGLPNLSPWEPRIYILDKDFDYSQDDSTWFLARRLLPPDATLHELSGCNDYGVGFTHRLGQTLCDGFPVITGFYFNFMGDDPHKGIDRHLDTLRVRFYSSAGDQLYAELGFQDKDPYDDAFCYSVTYAMVPRDHVKGAWFATGSSGGGSASRSFDPPMANPVLQGFIMDFKKDDHHIDEVGIDLTETGLKVWYNDKNDDDDFTWRAEWLELQ